MIFAILPIAGGILGALMILVFTILNHNTPPGESKNFNKTIRKLEKLSAISEEIARSERALDDYYVDAFYLCLESNESTKELKPQEKIEQELKSCLSSIFYFISKIKDTDEYFESYMRILNLYETEIKSLENITEDTHLLRRLREDEKTLRMFLDKFITLKKDLTMLRDNEKDMTYKQYTSFLGGKE